MGSEMCIRDRLSTLWARGRRSCAGPPTFVLLAGRHIQQPGEAWKKPKLGNYTINLSHLESPLVFIWIKQGKWQGCLPGYNDLGTRDPKVILPTVDHNSSSNTAKAPTVSPNDYGAPRQGSFSCTLWLCCSNDRRGVGKVDRLVHRMNR